MASASQRRIDESIRRTKELEDQIALLTKMLKGCNVQIIQFAKITREANSKYDLKLLDSDTKASKQRSDLRMVKESGEIMVDKMAAAFKRSEMEKDKSLQKMNQSKEHDAARMAKASDDETKRQDKNNKLSREKMKMGEEQFQQNQESLRLRRINRIDEIEAQGAEVRHNTRLRHFYKDQSSSYDKAMQMMTGMSVKGGIFGGMKGASQVLGANAEIQQLNKLLEQINIWSIDPTKTTEEQKMLNKRKAEKEQQRDLLQEKMGAFGALNPQGKGGILDRLNPLVEWAKKNQTGIIISAASIGLLFWTFKKLLSVSPMLQKMLEVINIAFNLILRPFGDFLGFMLRPIAMMMLSMVMPFFAQAYPILIKLGTLMGNQFAEFIKTGDPVHLLKGLGLAFETIPIQRILDYIFGDTENNIEGKIGTVGALLAAGVLGLFTAVTLSIVKMTRWVMNLFKIKIPGVSSTGTVSGVGGAPNDLGGNAKKKWTPNPNWRDGGQQQWNQNQKPNTTNWIQSSRNSVVDFFKSWKLNPKFNFKTSIRPGGGGAAFMVASMLDIVPQFYDFRVSWFKWFAENQPGDLFDGRWIDDALGGNLAGNNTQQSFANNTDSSGNIIINIENISSDMDLATVTEELATEARKLKLDNIGGE